MGRVGPSNTNHLMRASQGRGPWLTLNAWPLAVYRKALQALGVEGARSMNKADARNALLKFPKADVLRLLPRHELTDTERDAAHERLRRAGML